MNNLIPFDFEGSAVRVVMKGDDPWFVARDVCAVLEIEFHRDAIARLDDDERGSVVVDTLGGRQEMGAVNESGLYTLIFTSRKPEAKKFRRWVTGTMLPTLRRQGSFALPGRETAAALPPFPCEEWGPAIAAVREARRVRGRRAAQIAWTQWGLPEPWKTALGAAGDDEQTKNIEMFVEDRIARAPGQLCRAADMMLAVRDWAKANGVEPPNPTVFGKRLRAMGFESVKRSVICYRDIRLVEAA